MKPYQSILHPVDLDEISRPAFYHALKIGLCATGYPALAPGNRQPALLELLHCHCNGKGPAYARFPRVRQRLAAWGILEEEASQQALADLGLSVRKQWTSGEPGQEIARESQVRHCDLLVMATHARAGWSHFLKHSISAETLQACHVPGLLLPHDCPGFVSKDGGHLRLQRILLPIAPEPAPQPALGEAVRLLLTLEPSLGNLGGELRQVFVGPQESVPETQPPDPPGGWTWSREALKGSPVSALVRLARKWKPQLAVLTSRGPRTWLERCFGSTAEQLLHELGCPVLIVPGA